jgi:ABC-2 type transport system permease protein
MNSYLSIISTRFKSSIQYRAAAIAGFATQLFFGIAMVMVMDAFYSSSSLLPAMSLRSMINYIWLGQALLGMLPWNVDRDIQAMIRNGNVVYDFLRPLDLYFIWYFNSLAWRVSATILRSIPLLLTVSFIFPLIGAAEFAFTIPDGYKALAAFLTTYFFTILLSASITVFMNIITLLFISSEGLNVTVTAMVTLLSGMVIPLPLFPDSVQTILKLQPFCALVDVPFRYYVGNFKIDNLLYTIPHQIFWIFFFIVAGKFILSKVKKKLVIQGG